MIEVHPFATLGRFRNTWLNARHHFSFGEYYDPARMGVGGLRVWNDDEIAPGTGFDPHPHREMEIVTYVREGAITHRDSLGNEGRTEAGDVQVMHAGTGIVHAEYNLEPGPTRLFQIWILPGTQGVAPGWGTRRFPTRVEGTLTPLADGRAGANGEALPLHADAAVLAGRLRAGQSVTQALGAGRVGYLVAATGAVTVNGTPAGTRDGVTVTEEDTITITATEDAEVVMVDVAA
ncbi:Pirin family protein [Rhodovastum atsumiense]|uniref:Pirin family protein n=1 Tax=Rhodovastum atsumiense TaxID=504468 RepID=A0A5M6ITW1_9PROT|nr:pirin family protein [Rhodovastum atsumiense]KAA5610968.1 pirin family protein [Rhodovastum atsumiense]CAH2600256.1 Pirin family protein [Rhodovastum atsumiense]